MILVPYGLWQRNLRLKYINASWRVAKFGKSTGSLCERFRLQKSMESVESVGYKCSVKGIPTKLVTIILENQA